MVLSVQVGFCVGDTHVFICLSYYACITDHPQLRDLRQPCIRFTAPWVRNLDRALWGDSLGPTMSGYSLDHVKVEPEIVKRLSPSHT